MITSCSRCKKLMKTDAKVCSNCFAEYDDNGKLVKESNLTTLRWVLVILSPILIIYLNYLLISSFNLDSKRSLLYLVSFLYGIELVLPGYLIAPKNKVETALITALVFIFLGVLSMLIEARAMDLFAIAGLIITGIIIKFKDH